MDSHFIYLFENRIQESRKTSEIYLLAYIVIFSIWSWLRLIFFTVRCNIHHIHSKYWWNEYITNCLRFNQGCTNPRDHGVSLIFYSSYSSFSFSIYFLVTVRKKYRWIWHNTHSWITFCPLGDYLFRNIYRACIQCCLLDEWRNYMWFICVSWRNRAENLTL